jgi:phage repressor protein C with HTH and peptisase S24 domain
MNAISDDAAARLRRLRLQAGYATAADSARAMGAKVVTYQHHENRRRHISRQAAEEYGRFFGVPAGTILYGEALQEAHRVAIIGAVHTGGVVMMMSERRSVLLSGPMTGTDPLVALEVETDDLYPRYRRGELVFYEPPGPLPPNLAALNGLDCVVTTADGRTMIRMLTHKGGDRCTLVAFAGPPLLNVQIVAASPILWARFASMTPPPGSMPAAAE